MIPCQETSKKRINVQMPQKTADEWGAIWGMEATTQAPSPPATLTSRQGLAIKQASVFEDQAGKHCYRWLRRLPRAPSNEGVKQTISTTHLPRGATWACIGQPRIKKTMGKQLFSVDKSHRAKGQTWMRILTVVIEFQVTFKQLEKANMARKRLQLYNL